MSKTAWNKGTPWTDEQRLNTKLAHERKHGDWIKIPDWFRSRFNTAKQRCVNPPKGSNNEKRYKLRGIKFLLSKEDIIQLWKVYQNRLIYTGEKDLQLDRIDNDGNYELSNIRFITAKENNANTSKPDRAGGKHPMYGKTNYGSKGKNNIFWHGYWVTPLGKFTTKQEAAEAHGFKKQ